MDQARPSSEHRLKRKALWAALWLAKLIGFMPNVLCLPRRVQAYVERRLDILAVFVLDRVIIRATIGGRLRRALKVSGLKARAEAILHALQNLDRLTARFVRRMRKGLSRRMSAHTRPTGASLSCCAEMLGAKIALFDSTLAVELRAAAPP